MCQPIPETINVEIPITLTPGSPPGSPLSGSCTLSGTSAFQSCNLTIQAYGNTPISSNPNDWTLAINGSQVNTQGKLQINNAMIPPTYGQIMTFEGIAPWPTNPTILLTVEYESL